MRCVPREELVRRLLPMGCQLLEDEIALTERILQARYMTLARVGDFIHASDKGIQRHHSFPELLFSLYGLPDAELACREL